MSGSNGGGASQPAQAYTWSPAPPGKAEFTSTPTATLASSGAGTGGTAGGTGSGSGGGANAGASKPAYTGTVLGG